MQNELNRMVPPHTKPACSVVESVRCEQERAVHGDLGILRKKRRGAEKAGDVFQRPNVEVVDNGVEVVVVERILQGIHVGEHRRHQENGDPYGSSRGPYECGVALAQGLPLPLATMNLLYQRRASCASSGFPSLA